MTAVQRELFAQLQAAIPKEDKTRKVYSSEEFTKINKAVLRFEAAKEIFNVPEKSRRSGTPVADPNALVMDDVLEDPYYPNTDGTEDVGKHSEEEVQDRKRKAREEMIQMTKEAKEKQPPVIDHAKKAEQVESNWTQGMPKRDSPAPNSGWPEIAEPARHANDRERQRDRSNGRSSRNDRPSRYGRPRSRSRSPPRQWRGRRSRSRSPPRHRQGRRSRSRSPGMQQRGKRSHSRSRSRSPRVKLMTSRIKAPELKSFDREEIVAFVKKREQYETELRAEAQMQGFSYKGHARRWVDSVDRDMLETACDIIWGCKVEELSEETFKAHVMKIIETRPTTWEATESDMKRALRDVKLKLDGAIHGKALSFLNDVRRVIKTECLSESLKDIETRKLFMKAVISRITPVDLSQRVHDVFILKKRDYTLPELFEVMKEQMNRTLDAEAILMHREGCRKRERTDEKPSDTHKRHRSEHRSKYGPPHGRSATPPAAQRSKQEELRANTRQNQGASHYGPSNNKPQVTFEDHGAKGLC
ncbi:unnamed protein product [Aphanomyces euteiches]